VKFLKSLKKCFECIYLYFFSDLQLLFQYISSFLRLGFLLTFTDNELRLPVSAGVPQSAGHSRLWLGFTSSSGYM